MGTPGVIIEIAVELPLKISEIVELISLGSAEVGSAKGADSVLVPAGCEPEMPTATSLRRALSTPDAATVLFALLLRKQLAWSVMEP